MMTLFSCQVYLADQKPTNWGRHLYDSKVDRRLFTGHSHIDTDTVCLRRSTV